MCQTIRAAELRIPVPRRGFSYPRRKIPLGSHDALGGELPLVLQEIHGRLESHHFALPTVLPSHVEHEAEEHHCDAAAVVAGQVYGQQGAQAFAEGPQDGDGALTGRVARWTGSHERSTSARGGLCKSGGHRDCQKFVLLHWLDPDIRLQNCGTERRPPPRTRRRGARGNMKEERVTANRRVSVSSTDWGDEWARPCSIWFFRAPRGCTGRELPVSREGGSTRRPLLPSPSSSALPPTVRRKTYL